MLDLGIIHQSTSKWSASLYVVHVVNEKLQRMTYMWGLQVSQLCYQIRRVLSTHTQDITAVAQGYKYFNKLDLFRAHYQIPVQPVYIPNIAIITAFGVFEFLQVPFGQCNASQTFQWFINKVLHNLSFICAYVDDVLIASLTLQDDINYIRHAFERFDQYGGEQ